MTATETPHRGRARIAEPGEGIGLDELALAARNHGLPLEALRYDLTPAGLHYLLVHYDIPAVDPATWRLRSAGAWNAASSSTRRAPRAAGARRRSRSNAPATAGRGYIRDRSASRG